MGKESDLVQMLSGLMRDRGVIRAEREVDADMAAAMGLPEGQRRYLYVVGRISGYEALMCGRRLNSVKGDDYLFDLREVVIPTLRSLSTTSLRDLNSRQRKERVKEIEKIQSLIAEAENHLALTVAFSKVENLRELGKLQVRRQNQRTERILRHYSNLP
jgi:hypothetical protein